MELRGEIYTEDLAYLYNTLKIGQPVKMIYAEYTAGGTSSKEVTGIVKKKYPYHCICEYERHDISVMLVDIIIKNRNLIV